MNISTPFLRRFSSENSKQIIKILCSKLQFSRKRFFWDCTPPNSNKTDFGTNSTALRCFSKYSKSNGNKITGNDLLEEIDVGSISTTSDNSESELRSGEQNLTFGDFMKIKEKSYENTDACRGTSTSETTDRRADLEKTSNDEDVSDGKSKDYSTHKALMLEIRGKVAEQRSLSSCEWKELTDKAVNLEVLYPTFQGWIISACFAQNNFQAAKSYVDYLDGIQETIHVVLLSKFLQLARVNVNIAGRELVVKTCVRILQVNSNHSKHVLKTVVASLAETDEWKLSLKQLHEHKDMPSEVARHAYDAACKTAFASNDVDAAKDILDDAMSQRILPSAALCNLWINHYEKQRLFEPKNGNETIADMLEFCRKHWIRLPLGIAERIQRFYHNDQHADWEGNFVYIPENGMCPHCGNRLESSFLEVDEFETMRKHFIQKISRDSDCFLQVSREEFPDFKNFLKSVYPYDVVVDGTAVASFLNVDDDEKATMESQLIRLFEVLKPLWLQRKRVVVIASTEMIQWKNSTDLLKLMKKKCRFFFTTSKRQAFLLVAALYGGSDVQLIARNFLERYNPHNEDVEMMSYLRQWHFGHVVSFVVPELLQKLQLLMPFEYNPKVQITGSTVHVACTVDEEPAVTFRQPEKWLCLKKLELPTALTTTRQKKRKI